MFLIQPLINKSLKILMLEAEKKVYEQVLNNQQSKLGQSGMDDLLDLLLEINKQLAELKKNLQNENGK